MHKYLLKIGQVKSVFLVTISAVSLSDTFTILSILILRKYGIYLNIWAALIISSLVPLIIAPIVNWQVIGLALKVYKLEEEMRHLATYDALTGLLGRRAFLEQSTHCLNLAKREGIPFSLMIVDLDHFKKINDKYGHMGGDRVLETFGKTILKISRKSDLAGRFGGEEFAFFLPNTSAEQAFQFANRLLESINQTEIDFNDQRIQYTASIGLISTPFSKMENIEELINLADKTLYKAKENGRNQICIYKET